MKTSQNPLTVFGLSLLLVAIAFSDLHAGSATWLANPANGNWNDPSNWTAGGPPNGASDTATFATSSGTGLSISANVNINAMVFSAGASSFTITTKSSLSLMISGVGITNNSGTIQKIVNDVDASGNPGVTFFSANANAGNTMTFFTEKGSVPSMFNNFGGAVVFMDTSSAGAANFTNEAANNGAFGSGLIQFHGSSSAGNASFTNKGAINNNGGLIEFWESSTAGNAAFVNEGSTKASPGIVRFLDDSNAANATIINDGNTVMEGGGGITVFAGSSNSTAGNAILIANAGANGGGGGIIYFYDASTGGTARVEVFGNGSGDSSNGTLDISLYGAPTVGVGSIEGNGNVFVGSNNLTVGSSNTSRSFSGVMRTGPQGGNGLLTYIGTGILTFEGGAGNDHIGDGITLSIAAASTINLNFTGDPDTIRSLIVGGIAQSPGLYGSATSGAPHQLPQFAGTGRVLAKMVAVSRKTHGTSGDFDINLPFGGAPGVECRSGGANGNYQVVVTFLNPVTFSGANVQSGTGMVSGTSGNGTTIVTVNLNGVTNAQTIFVTLSNVNDGATTETIPIPMEILIGDTGGNGVVNASDVTQTKAQAGHAVTNSNFREDVNGNGAINASDVSLVKSRAGTALP